MRRYIACLMLVFTIACSTTKVINKEQAEGVDLSSYKSFDFYTVEANGDTISRKFNDRIAKLENAIALQLQKKGYLMTKTNPDLLINIGIVINEKVQTRETNFSTDAPKYIGQRRYSWKSQEVPVGSYREGTVTVDLVDRINNKLVWTGTVKDIIPEKDSKLDVTIKEGVEKLFAGFPAAK
jgi:uncharacterized protein DUF4136